MMVSLNIADNVWSKHSIGVDAVCILNSVQAQVSKGTYILKSLEW